MNRLLKAAMALAVAAPGSAFASDATERALAAKPGEVIVQIVPVRWFDGRGNSDSLWLGEARAGTGIAPGWEIEILAPLYRREREAGVEQSGFGDLALRLRGSLHEGDDAEAGIIGYLTVPTAEDGLGVESVSGGLIFAGEFALGETWEAVWTAGLDFSRLEDGDETSLSGALAFERDLVGDIDGYWEISASHATEAGETSALFTVGTIFEFDNGAEIDVGIGFGLTDESPRAGAFLILSRSF